MGRQVDQTNNYLNEFKGLMVGICKEELEKKGVNQSIGSVPISSQTSNSQDKGSIEEGGNPTTLVMNNKEEELKPSSSRRIDISEAQLISPFLEKDHMSEDEVIPLSQVSLSKEKYSNPPLPV